MAPRLAFGTVAGFHTVFTGKNPSVGGRPSIRVRGLLVAGAAALVLGAAPAGSWARSNTTLTQTIQDRDGDNGLEPAPGEDYVVRDDLGQANPGRNRRLEELLFFGQLTDKHVVDEESPLRVEFLDKLGPPLTGAYRPQEGMSTQVVNEMVRQLRNTNSPVTGRQIQLVMTTGDNSDNTQLNETRWFIDLLDGGVQVDPNSGVEGTCDAPKDGLYDGVRGQNEYYEPDASPGADAGADEVDGRGYSPNQAENEAEAQRSNSVRDFPGLFDDMNKPFRSTGLGVPWYGIFGNHDALLQGNQPRNPALETFAMGCVKPTSLSASALAQVQAIAAGGLTPAEYNQVLAIATADMRDTAANPGAATSGDSMVVPSDPRRRPLRKSEYIAEHFTTGGTPVGHGFTAANVASGMGNYSFHPKPGVPLKFVVLDSIAEAGGDGGNIDDAQFQWIHQELADAEANHEYVVAFAHHSLRTMNQAPLSIFPPGDNGGNLSPIVHFGLGEDEPDSACPETDPAAPPIQTETLRCLFLRHHSVIAFVNGHEHANRISPFPRVGEGGGRALGGFWEVNTASHIDWPQQSRVLDVVDNGDGNLSVFTTIVDHNGSPQPGGHPPSDGGGQSPESVQRLAGISRELSFNDPDSANGEDGQGDARGGPADRNAELVVRNPYGP